MAKYPNTKKKDDYIPNNKVKKDCKISKRIDKIALNLIKITEKFYSHFNYYHY